MFTDKPATPARLEVLVKVLRELSANRLDKTALCSLCDPLGDGKVVEDTLSAARELGLMTDNDGRLSFSGTAKTSARESILGAFDEVVLCAGEKSEKYFALFYSYLLGRRGAGPANRELEVAEFNRTVFGDLPQGNPFNPTKHTGFHRWVVYCGLGWTGPDGKFVCNPFERLQRTLPAIFSGERKLDSQAFMLQLAHVCPELDGGAVFKQANPVWNASDMRCSVGLCDALSELHDAGVIRLHCPADARGWSLEDAPPAPQAPDVLGAKIDFVELK